MTSVASPAATTTALRNVADIYALTPVQRAMLAHAVSGGNSTALVEQLSCQLQGPLDTQRLRAAWERAARRHAVLRTCFQWEGLKQPLQIVRREVELSWQEHDYREYDAAEIDERLAAQRRIDRHRGFDLSRAPLSRWQLIRTADEVWHLTWTCHHLILDGLSVPLVLKEAFGSYAGIASDTPPSSSTFRDYVAWLRERDESQSVSYWQQELTGCQPAQPLPIEVPARAFTIRAEHEARKTKLSGEDTRELRRAASQIGVSVNAFVQAAWALLLSRYCERDEILFANSVAGRPYELAGADEIVGPLSNVVPLKARLYGDIGCENLLRDLHARQLAILDHQHLPLEEIQRAAGFSPAVKLCRSLVVFESHAAQASGDHQVGPITISKVRGTASAAFPLVLVAIPGDAVELKLQFDPTILPAGPAERLLEQYCIVLTAMAKDPAQRLGDLSLLSDDQRRAVRQRAREGTKQIVLDRAGQLAPPDVPGRIWELANRCDPSGSDTEREIPEDLLSLANNTQQWCATDERAIVRADGEIHSLGAVDAPLRIGGYGIDPEHVGQLLAQHALVNEAAVVAREDRSGRAQLAAFIVPSTQTATAIAEQPELLIIQQLRESMTGVLPAAAVPALWRVVSQLPRTADGQLEEQALPDAMRPRDESLGAYVAPRNELERRLAAIWEELLGVEPVGVYDSFLDLGGDSLAAVALLSRLESEFDMQLPLVSLLHEPTLARLATMLAADDAGQESPTLVPLRTATAGAPLFCVHPAGGTVFCYLELARRLPAEIPVFGLQAQGLDGRAAPHDSIEAMAAHYARAITAAGHAGPLRLCGWSSGGIVAFELARQLQEQGIDIASLALLDAGVPRPGQAFDEHDILPMLMLMFPGEDPQQIETLRHADHQAQLDYFRSRAEAAQLLMSGVEGSQAGHVLHVFQANMAAVVAYQPQPFAGRMFLIRSSEHATPLHDDPHLGWAPWVTGGIEVAEAPGGHLELLREPAVDRVAELLAGI